MKSGEPITVWIERIGAKRGYVFESFTQFEQHMDERVANGLSRLFEWRTGELPHSGTVRLADEAREGIDWLRGHGEEIDNALIATRGLS